MFSRTEMIEKLGLMTKVVSEMFSLDSPEDFVYQNVPAERVAAGITAMMPGYTKFMNQQMAEFGDLPTYELSPEEMAEVLTIGEMLVDRKDGTYDVRKFLIWRFEQAEAGNDYMPMPPTFMKPRG